MPLLIATGNAGKLREFGRQLEGIELVSPADLGLDLEVEETGDTFEANARHKAESYAGASGLPALADDSGLEVDALGGAPGVLSARFGGPGLSDGQRCGLLLEKLSGRRLPTERRARFRCVLVAAASDGRTCRAEGVCEGRIALAPRGASGFGYDPVFYLPELDCTMAELAAADKDRLSHRGRALRAVRPLLQATFPELHA